MSKAKPTPVRHVSHRWTTLILLGLGLLSAGPTGCAALLPRSISPLARLEQSLVFHPAAYPYGDWKPTRFKFEDAWIETPDGLTIHGWHLHHDEPAAVALYCHGNAGNITYFADTLEVLHKRHRLSVLGFDYRGFGRSEGKPTEEGVYTDARAARRWLAEREGVDESEIVLLGQSLGGGVAVELASTDGCRGLVLASTFTSLPDVAKWHAPWLPARTLMTHTMTSIEKIRKYDGPLLLVHGTQDRVVPFKHGEALFEAAAGDKTMVIVPDGDHIDPLPEDYRLAFDRFIGKLKTPTVLNSSHADSRKPRREVQKLRATRPAPGHGREDRVAKGLTGGLL
jgi:fermentation-respiration switch protein FrsA (DUF1100 family)